MTDDRLKTEDWHAALASSTRRRVLELLVTSGSALDAVAVSQAISLHVTTARFHLEQLEAVGLIQREVLRVAGQRGRPRVLFSIPAPTPEDARSPESGASPIDMQEQLSRALISVFAEDIDGGRARAVRAGENWSLTLPDAVRIDPAFAPTPAEPTPVEPVPVEPRLPESEPEEPTEQTLADSDPASLGRTDAGLDTPGGAAPVGLGALHRTGARTGAAGPYLTVLDDLGFAPEVQSESVLALRACPFREEARENPGVVCSVHLGLLRGVAHALGESPDDVGLRPFVTPTLCLVDLPGRRGDASAIKTD